MTTKSNRVAALSVAVIAVCALAGCGFDNGEGLPTLERGRTATDVLPADLVAQLDGDDGTAVDPETVRLAGELEGAQFFVARTNDDRQYCLIIYSTAAKWGAGCSETPQMETSILGGYSARFTMDGMIPQGVNEDGWVALTDDVLARKSGGRR